MAFLPCALKDGAFFKIMPVALALRNFALYFALRKITTVCGQAFNLLLHKTPPAGGGLKDWRGCDK
ncbi:MAG: hypothetical protein D6732_12945 [Methanobacteriota archaeon]|nr:MAG: hypothetical protein D6732_12945 [Euryarchaeota archaeon]